MKCKIWTKQNHFIRCCTRHSEISKKKKVCGCAHRSSYRELNFPLCSLCLVIGLIQNFFRSFTFRVRSNKAHTSATFFQSHDVTEFSALPRIKNRERLKSLSRLSQRLKSLVLCSWFCAALVATYMDVLRTCTIGYRHV